MLDGIDIAERTRVVALGITTDGVKIPLGLWEGSTENVTPARSLLSDLDGGRSRDVGDQRAALKVAGGGGRERTLGESLTVLALAAERDFPVDDRAERALGRVVGRLDAADGDKGLERAGQPLSRSLANRRCQRVGLLFGLASLNRARSSIWTGAISPAVCRDPRWARLGSNQRPLACEASALPLSYAPGCSGDSTLPRLSRSESQHGVGCGADVPAAISVNAARFANSRPNATRRDGAVACLSAQAKSARKNERK